MNERQKKTLFYTSLFLAASATDLLATVALMVPNHIGEQNALANDILKNHGILAVAAVKSMVALGGAITINLIAKHKEHRVRSVAEMTAMATFGVTLAMPIAWIGTRFIDSNTGSIANFLRMSAMALHLLH